MVKEITVDDQKISYNLRKNRRARNMRITINCDGNCIVSAPRWVSNHFIEKFILEKANWIIEKVDAFRKSGNGRNSLLRNHSRKEYLENKERALASIKSRLNYFNQFYNLSWKRISIRNQRTRWGSCSRKGNLNFNYKIILLPEKCADYIIVHELCHIQEFNHSRSFWELLSKTIPEYKEIVKSLRKI
jgi:predicted metal-dependent hydrolase